MAKQSAAKRKEEIMTELQSKHFELCSEIEYHNRLYHLENAPEITDEAYDALYRNLVDMEREHPELVAPWSPTQYVGVRIVPASFAKTPHEFPMLSLANAFSAAEVLEFFHRSIEDRQRKIIVVPEFKFDGLSIELVYENGVLVRAVTRGDGAKGDDVTANAMMVKSIPKVLQSMVAQRLIVRAEIIMTFEAFNRLNDDLVRRDLPPFANPRNAAAGTMRLKDPVEVGRRDLTCIAYDIMNLENITEPDAENEINIPETLAQLDAENNNAPAHVLAMLGFNVVIPGNPFDATDTDQIQEITDRVKGIRNTLPFPIDGMVFKLSDTASRITLGNNTKDPKWGVAFKYPAERVTTLLQDIEYSIGRTGAITPVAVLKPVQIGGTVVERASLHNFDYAMELGIGIPCEVVVEKAAEIIPQIIKVTNYADGYRELTPPTNCPICGTPVERKQTKSGEETKAVYCMNPMCSGSLKRTLAHFVSRDGMNIEALGPQTIELLFDRCLIKKPSSLFRLHPEDLNGVPGFADVSVNNLFDAIEKARTIPLENFIFALGIPGVGKESAKALADLWVDKATILAFLDSSNRTLVLKQGRSQRDTTDILRFFAHPEIEAEVRELLSMVNFTENTKRGTTLRNLVFVVTGSFSVGREELERTISDYGGKVTGAVSKNTDYLVRGENGGSKYEKAQAIIAKGGKIKIIDEEGLMAMMRGENV
jgi:DNA ligase (NAD+)